MKLTSIYIPPELLDRVENLRSTRRFPSRNQTLTRLVEAGLDALAKQEAAANVAR